MIAKCKAVGGSAAGMAYLFQDKEDKTKIRGYELDRNMLIGESPNELMSELKAWNRDNANELKNAVFSMVLSPAGEDGKALNDMQLRKLCQSFMQDTLGIDPSTQPYYMRVHEDTLQKHVHIYLPRTNAQGKTISDKLCQYRAMNAADRLAKEYGLTRAMEIQRENVQQLAMGRRKIQVQLNKVLKHCRSFEEFKEQSRSVGVEILESINKQGQLQGYRLKMGDVNLKASQVDRNLTLGKLDSLFQQNSIRIVQELSRVIVPSFSPGRDRGEMHY